MCTQSNIKARRAVSFKKSTARQSRQERGTSLCAYCGVEHGSENEHIWPTHWYEKHPKETRLFFEAILGRKVKASEITNLMRSGNNHAPACTRCNNVEKRRDENDAYSPEGRQGVAFKWLNKAKKFDGEKWLTRRQQVTTGKKKSHVAQEIAALKGKDVFKRAAFRRQARGRVAYPSA